MSEVNWGGVCCALLALALASACCTCLSDYVSVYAIRFILFAIPLYSTTSHGHHPWQTKPI